MTDRETIHELPVVPLRDLVVFPHMMAPFVVGRKASVRALERTLDTTDKHIFLVAQKDPRIDDPASDDLYEVGVIARVVQNLKLASGNIKVMVEGFVRAEVEEFIPGDEHLTARVRELLASTSVDPPVPDYMKSLTERFKEYAKLSHHLSVEGVMTSLQTSDPDEFADILAAHLVVPTAEKQDLLRTVAPLERLQRLQDLLDVEIEKLNIDRRINSRVKKQMEKAQREYYLSEKIRVINEELGRGDVQGEIEELRERVEESGMSEEAHEKALHELKRLEGMPPVSAEAGVSRNYIDWLLAVPWKKASRENRDIERAATILQEDHYGLEKVKERILEFLAVRRLIRKPVGTILCFVGPPGVGKTSLGRSIARATRREFVRLALGGVRDEAEIRGHRRTYIGALPGQVIQMMRRAGTVNPVILLDEVDKMSADFRGDPASALLEVLDPEQNHTFQDHYLDVDYDLSKVLFLCTANVTDTIPPTLLDRMEVIELSGYTHREKLEIGRRFLLPRQVERHGLQKFGVELTEDAFQLLIERYTREAGVRNLERQLASICRKLARNVLREKRQKGETVTIDADDVGEVLGRPRFRRQQAEKDPQIGVATGLAWTQVGGDLLSTEVTLMRGSGKLTLTGQLGDVMQESARAALSFLRARCDRFDVDPEGFEKTDVHIHVPEGAIPKDGPSAGITIATALISAFSGEPVRADVAMTGEITLRGRVLPVGGIKEKVLAGHRAGVTTVLLPEENEKDLDEVPEEVRDELNLVLVSHMDEVLDEALETRTGGATRPSDKKRKGTRPSSVAN